MRPQDDSMKRLGTEEPWEREWWSALNPFTYRTKTPPHPPKKKGNYGAEKNINIVNFFKLKDRRSEESKPC